MVRDRHLLRNGSVAAATTCSVVAVLMGPMAPALPVTVALVGIVTVVLVASFAVHAWRHHAIAAALRRTSTPDRLAGLPVRVAPVGATAFVAGLIRPEIFCGPALADELSPEELRAVVLHERAHQLAHDPLRTTVLAALAPAVERTASGRRWLGSAAATYEIAADRYALDQGVRRSALASALLKVQPASVAHAAAFAPAVDLRLRALIDDDIVPTPGLQRAIVLGAVVGSAACAAMLLPIPAIVAAVCC